MYVCMYVSVYIYIIINIKVYHKIFPQFRTNYSWFQTLVSIKREKKKKQKAKKLPLHTKKTNNTNKLQFCPNKNSKITKL